MTALNIKDFNSIPAVTRVERWDTQNGVSVRVVKRTEGGQFVNNKSARQLLKAQA